MNAIRHYRKLAGLTQVQLAELAGVDQTTISGLECDPDRMPQLDIAVKIAGALGVAIDVVFPVDARAS